MKKTPMRFPSTNTRNEKILREPATIKPFHNMPIKRYADYILLPIGMFYNVDEQEVETGDVLQFKDGNSVNIQGRYILDTSKPYCDAVCRMRYGFGIIRAMELWRNNAIATSNDASVIDTTKCLMITYLK